MFKNPQSSAPDSRQGLRMIAYAVLAGALVIFAGLAIVAISVVNQSSDAGWAVSALTDRSLHYALIAVTVICYVYLQRR